MWECMNLPTCQQKVTYWKDGANVPVGGLGQRMEIAIRRNDGKLWRGFGISPDYSRTQAIHLGNRGPPGRISGRGFQGDRELVMSNLDPDF